MIFVLITAAGVGSRFNTSLPKQFVKINNKELLKYTIDCYSHLDCKIFLGLSEEYINEFNDCRVIKYIGGNHNQETIKKGLEIIQKESSYDDIILICDGNRPLVSKEIINSEIEFVMNNQDKIVCPAIESYGLFSSDGKHSIDRSTIVQVQMPCCCNFNKINNLYSKVTKFDFNNPMELWARYDKVDFVKGDYKNIKITYAEDLDLFLLFSN